MQSFGAEFARQKRASGATDAPAGRSSVHGRVAPGFEQVRVEFERNFAERGEIGAAVAAYCHGEKVVDLWGGRRTPHGDAPWNEDTMVMVASTTKGLAAMTLAIANARGWLDYDAPVAHYWREFAQNGKAAITVRQLLGHDAGLACLPDHLSFAKLHDLDYLARLLARQRARVAIGHTARLPCDVDRPLHAGDHPPRGPGAPHARPLLPRGGGRAARPRLLHRAAFRDPRRASRHRPAPVPRACDRRDARGAESNLVPRVLWPWSLLRKSMGS